MMITLRTAAIRPSASLVFCLLLAPTLGGCDWVSRSSSDTTMRNVEILPGTASDEMITLDQASGDGTSIDTSVATGPVAAAAPSTDDATESSDDDAPDAPISEASNTGDVIIRPPGQ